MTDVGAPPLPDRPLDVFLVVGEHSGDQLGYKVMQALRQATGGQVAFRGVGGEAMAREGLHSLFPLSDIAVMGVSAVLGRLPLLLRRIRDTARAVAARVPDVLVIIDSPDFTHRVAARVRRLCPSVPVVDYVSPSVWAWRSGRARTMRRYVDHVLALLPFEPAAHARLGGPPCTYVGHPLVERLGELRPDAAEQARRDESPPVVLLLPGSRRVEIRRLLADFGAAAGRIAAEAGPVEFVLPAVPHLADAISEAVATWPVRPRIVLGEGEKLAAFRVARAALAASGTVTLELALSGVPMAVAYRVSRPEVLLKYLIEVSSIVLPNIVLGENVVPEFLQADCTPTRLADAMVPLVRGGAAREAQLAAFRTLDGSMRLPGDTPPSEMAARIVLEVARARKGLEGLPRRG